MMLLGLYVGFPQSAGNSTFVALDAGMASNAATATASSSTLGITDRDKGNPPGSWSRPWRAWLRCRSRRCGWAATLSAGSEATHAAQHPPNMRTYVRAVGQP